MNKWIYSLCPLLMVLSAMGQTAKPVHPQDLKGYTVPSEPANLQPAATTLNDAKYHVSFRVPAGWDSERKDGVLSTFSKDVRSASSSLILRGVASINYNPYPASTFSGALFYYSIQPGMNADSCAAVTHSRTLKPAPDVKVNNVAFHHGHDEYGGTCTEARNDVYTTLSGTSCVRFDLVVNTFCPQSSGAMPINEKQLNDIYGRLNGMLNSIHIQK